MVPDEPEEDDENRRPKPLGCPPSVMKAKGDDSCPDANSTEEGELDPEVTQDLSHDRILRQGSRPSVTQKKSRREFHAAGVVDAEEEIAFFENLQRVRKAFLENDLNNDGVITAGELAELADKLGGQAALYDTEAIGRIIIELKEIARKKGSVDDRLNEEGIPFEIFAQILYSQDLDEEIEEELQDSVRILRNFFRDCGNARILAEAADVTMFEIDNLDMSIGERILRVLDPVMGVIIFLNAVMIGVSIDHNNPEELEIVEYFFVVCYVGEVAFKLWHFGPMEFFLGIDWAWHWCDFTLAIIGFADFIIGLQGADTDLGVILYLRLLRVTRLVRLVRLMRTFKDLSIMVTGLLAGLKTMMWVMLILAMVIYSLAVVLTSTVGRDHDFAFPFREELFGTVTRSMFTMFVCLTDGCTNYDGTPISLHLFSRYGMPFLLSYSLAMVLITFGLFNLIMAIFVENTMEAAKSNDTAIAAARHKESLRIARKLKLVIRQFTVAQSSTSRQQRKLLRDVENEMKSGEGLRGYIKMLSNNEVTQRESISALVGGDEEFKLSRAQFEAILATKPVQALMDELEIDETDRKGLFDVLDADSSGTLTIEELVSGLMAVRGQAKKSDTVATMLAVKSVQKSLRTTAALLLQNHHWVDERLQALEARHEAFQEEIGNKLSSMQRSMQLLAKTPRESSSMSPEGRITM